MLDELDELEFEAVGSELSDAFCDTVTGKSPYNGTLPFVVELKVYYAVVDDEFVVTVRHGREVVAQVSSMLTFVRDLALCIAAQNTLKVDMPDALADMTSEIANYGYRFISTPTGLFRGHVETVLLMADSISELDAAMKLGSDPECVYSLIDAGADPMRHHIKFGRPYEVAQLLAYRRDDYWGVVEYMRAAGAHSFSSAR